MLQLHKITASALTAFFLISGIFAPYGSSYPFFSSTKFGKVNPNTAKESKKTNKSDEYNQSKGFNSRYHNNDICFEKDLDQKKIVDFGTNLILCQTMFLIINLYSRLRNSQKLIDITNLSLDLITYIHKMDGKKRLVVAPR